MKFSEGQRVIAWCYEDYVESGGRDIGDNSQFWKPATILRLYRLYRWESQFGNDDLAEVAYDHRERPSRGLFLSSLRPMVAPDDAEEIER